MPADIFVKKTIENILVIGLLMRRLANLKPDTKILEIQQQNILKNEILKNENNEASNVLVQKKAENELLKNENDDLSYEINELTNVLAVADTIVGELTAEIQQQQQSVISIDPEYTKQKQINNTNSLLLKSLKNNELIFQNLDSSIEHIIFSNDIRHICPEREHGDEMLEFAVFGDFKLVIPLENYFYDKFGRKSNYAKIWFGDDEHNSFRIEFNEENIYIDSETVGSYVEGDIIEIVLPSYENNMIINNKTENEQFVTQVEFEQFCKVADENFFSTGLEVQWLATTFPKQVPVQLKMPMNVKIKQIDRKLRQMVDSYQVLNNSEFVHYNDDGEMQINYSEKPLIKIGKLKFHKYGVIVSEIIDTNFRIGIVKSGEDYDTADFSSDNAWEVYYQNETSPETFVSGVKASLSMPKTIESLSIFFSKTINSESTATEFINFEVKNEDGVWTKTENIVIDETLEYEVVFESTSTNQQIGSIPYFETQNLYFFKNFNQPSCITNGLVCEQINESEVVLVTMPKNKNIHSNIYLRQSQVYDTTQDNIEIMNEYDNVFGELFVKEFIANGYEQILSIGDDNSRIEESDGGFYEFYIYYDKFSHFVYYILVDQKELGRSSFNKCTIYREKTLFMSGKIDIIYEPGTQIEQIKYNEPYFTKINQKQLLDIRVYETLNIETPNYKIWSNNSVYTTNSYLQQISLRSIIGILPGGFALFEIEIDENNDQTLLVNVASFFNDNPAYEIEIYRIFENFNDYANIMFVNEKLAKTNRQINYSNTEPDNELKIFCNKQNVSVTHNGYTLNFIDNEETIDTTPFYVEIVAHSYVRLYSNK